MWAKELPEDLHTIVTLYITFCTLQAYRAGSATRVPVANIYQSVASWSSEHDWGASFNSVLGLVCQPLHPSWTNFRVPWNPPFCSRMAAWIWSHCNPAWMPTQLDPTWHFHLIPFWMKLFEARVVRWSSSQMWVVDTKTMWRGCTSCVVILLASFNVTRTSWKSLGAQGKVCVPISIHFG